MAHGVSPVMHAREPRLTLVNSYQSNNPFAKPATFYRTFKVRVFINLFVLNSTRLYLLYKLIISYIQDINFFFSWYFVFSSFFLLHKTKVQDPVDAHGAEIGRHYAWRVRGQLDYILENGLFGVDNEKVLSVLEDAKQELEHVSALIRGAKNDESPYKIDPTTKRYKIMQQTQDEAMRKIQKSKL